MSFKYTLSIMSSNEILEKYSSWIWLDYKYKISIKILNGLKILIYISSDNEFMGGTIHNILKWILSSKYSYSAGMNYKRKISITFLNELYTWKKVK